MPDVVLPVLNEAEALPWVLRRMPAGYRPIVVDNGSTDGSAEIAQRRGARVVEAKVRGFGAACFAGLEASGSDIVCFMDCDGSLDPRALPELAAPVMAGTSDLMLGARRAVDGAWPTHARLANRLLVFALRRRSGLQLEDLGPMRAGDSRDLVVVCRHDAAVQLPRGPRGLDAPDDQRLAPEQLEVLARHRLGAAASWDDGQRR